LAILCLVANAACISGLFLVNCPFSFSNVYVVGSTFPSLNVNFIQLLPIDEVNNVFVEPMTIWARVMIMVFNATLNNISVISWRSVFRGDQFFWGILNQTTLREPHLLLLNKCYRFNVVHGSIKTYIDRISIIVFLYKRL
jgi:hypothetical protein